MIDIIHHGAFSKFIMSRRTKTENDKKRLRRAGEELGDPVLFQMKECSEAKKNHYLLCTSKGTRTRTRTHVARNNFLRQK